MHKNESFWPGLEHLLTREYTVSGNKETETLLHEQKREEECFAVQNSNPVTFHKA